MNHQKPLNSQSAELARQKRAILNKLSEMERKCKKNKKRP
jgi:hypothetical protein